MVEDVVDRLEIGLAYTRRFERQSEKPLIYMTRRVMLDAFLVEQACEAGAVFRDGTKVTELELGTDEVVVKTKDWAGTLPRGDRRGRDERHRRALRSDATRPACTSSRSRPT